MKKFLFLLTVNLLFCSTLVFSADSGYLSMVVSQIPKSHSVEAMDSLSGYKAILLGCLMTHEGFESACATLDFPPTAGFNYEFSQFPQDGIKSWALQASGNNQVGLNEADIIILTSNDHGDISCQGSGRLLSSC